MAQTAKEKAQHELEVAQRKVDKITKRKAAAEAQVETLKNDLEAAVAYRDFVKQHPALTQETVVETPAAEAPAEETKPEAQPTLGAGF